MGACISSSEKKPIKIEPNKIETITPGKKDPINENQTKIFKNSPKL